MGAAELWRARAIAEGAFTLTAQEASRHVVLFDLQSKEPRVKVYILSFAGWVHAFSKELAPWNLTK